LIFFPLDVRSTMTQNGPSGVYKRKPLIHFLSIDISPVL
jgi:hypothetical protein